MSSTPYAGHHASTAPMPEPFAGLTTWLTAKPTARDGLIGLVSLLAAVTIFPATTMVSTLALVIIAALSPLQRAPRWLCLAAAVIVPTAVTLLVGPAVAALNGYLH